jgi:hypothetical protein
MGKIMQKIYLSFLMALCFLAATEKASAQATSGQCGTNLTWELTGTDSDLILSVSGSGAMTDFQNYSYVP